MSKTLKITIILAVIYVIGWLGLHYWSTQHTQCGSATIFCPILPLDIVWMFGFPVLGIIIVVAALILEAADAKKKKQGNLPQ